MQSSLTVCLNMIVKDEAHIIRRTLAMLCSKIRFDYWVICDTGSADATREIVQEFFATEGIEGELHCDEWVNFAHNRTKALAYAFGKTDLLLVFDADDDIHGAIALPTSVTHDEYHLKFGSSHSGGISYTRTLLINNRKRFKYCSVVHEYISCLEPSANETLRICLLGGDYHVVSGRSGARNQDPDKYLKDALLLEAAHAEALAQGDPLHKRYAFYCANSYRDCGRHEDAIRWYKATLAQDNWAQEKYVSCLYIYHCYEALGQKEHGFFHLVKALHYDLERAECLHPLVVHYCCENANDVAYGYYRIVQAHYERAQLQSVNEPNSGSKLFLETDKANFFLPYYMIIVADRVGDRACGVRMYEIIFRKKQRTFSHWHLRNLFFNLRFFLKFVGSVHELANGESVSLPQFVALANEYVRFLRENGGVPSSAFDEIVKDFNYAEWGIHFNPCNATSPLCSAKSSPNFSRSECKRSRAILFYAGYSVVPWNHSSMLRGALGGSERAVAHLSNELCRQGYIVYVSGGVQPEESVGVKYVGLSDLPELLRTTAFHTIICSRYVSFLELYGGSASWHRFYVWAHDTHLLSYGCDLSDTAIIEKWSDRIDGCVCQTQWHADEYARQYPTLQSRIRVINNGIDTALFPSTLSAKVRNRFIYTSRTERGLARILDLWPDILAMMPDATLVVSTYVAFPCNDDERRIQARIAELNQANQEEQEHCIRHLGQLNHEKLYAEMGAAEYWLYPTDWPETSCITAMEMLMSGVICLYYPVAGLTDTMGGCGIQIAPGTEVDALVNIVKHGETEQAKQREQGRAYAESCGWATRAQQWNKLLHDLRVAIVNTLPYHYEMFGYVLHHFAKKGRNGCNGAIVSIFTETGGRNWGWFDFYKEHFGNMGFEFECTEFNKFSEFKIREQFDVIFVTTDDDMGIKREWMDERFIAIEHTPMLRRPEYRHRIAIRPFPAGVALHDRWALPCYNIATATDKMRHIDATTTINVALIGGYRDINVEFINRIAGPVKLHFVGCCWNPHNFNTASTCATNEFVPHGVLHTRAMLELLQTCDYVITDVNNKDHIAGKSMSGSIPLAFSTLTPIIIGRTNNSIYKFKSVVEVDLNSSEPIVLNKISNEMVSAVALERDELVRMADVEFDRCMECIHNHTSSALTSSPIPKRVMQTWEHKQLNPEFQAIADTWKTHNPQCEFVLMDAAEREQFIRAHFERSVITAYQRIVPGAYKSDLFRYCYLWVNGGVYVDIDTLCLGSLDDFLTPGVELVVPIDLNLSANEGTHNLACGFIAAVPRHPAMMRCIQKIVRNVETGTVPGSKLDFSGPGILGRAVNECLHRGETASFVGNEGLHASAKIHFLKFEPGTEFVKNMKNQVLFQNKNGNHEIASLYHAECCKLKDFVSWVQCASPIAATLTHTHNESKKNIALMIYGQFRSYAANLRENVRMLAPLLKDNVVHVFVLSNKLAAGNYSEQNEREVRSILDEAGFNVCFFEYVENLDSDHAANERAVHDSYFANLQNNAGVNNEFIPAIMYRKFALNEIKNAYCKEHDIDIDLHVFGRLFDVIIKHPAHAASPSDHTKRIQYEINKLTVCSSDALTVLGSSETLFIGTREPMDYLFELATAIKTGGTRGAEMWDDSEFTEVMMRADSCLCMNRATYSPEVQYIARVHYSKFKYKNIRFDFNNPKSAENDASLYDIRLDPLRTTQ